MMGSKVPSPQQNDPTHTISPEGEFSERSPLLKALRSTPSYEGGGNYMSLPPISSNSSDPGQFRPTVYAEKALEALLNGVLFYVLCCIIGLFVVSLYFEGLFGDAFINWWLLFTPFWVANLVMILAHVNSIRYAKKLRQWAEIDVMSNEPLLPLLRRIVVIYAISFPLCVLLLWSELAFCARLEASMSSPTHPSMTTSRSMLGSTYICYAPLMVIQTAFFIRYLLCRSDSTLPGVCWILSFVFTLLVAYQTNNVWAHPGVKYVLSWWVVFAPLFAFEALMFGSLMVVLCNEFQGIYRLTRWQLGASVLYTLSLFAGVIGEIMMLKQIDYRWGTLTFASAFVFSSLVCASIALYIVGKYHVESLMASKGGAVPVPLTKTENGWITNHAIVEQWILLGDIYLTNEGLEQRNRKKRCNSDVESSQWMMSLGKRGSVLDRLRTWWSKPSKSLGSSTGANNGKDDPESRLYNMMRRRTSGSYSDIKVEIDDESEVEEVKSSQKKKSKKQRSNPLASGNPIASGSSSSSNSNFGTARRY